jgi:hypothetical protein
MFTRVGQNNSDKEALIELEELASKGISDNELESVVSDYKNQEERKISSALRTLDIKREKSAEGLSSGRGGFKRAP